MCWLLRWDHLLVFALRSSCVCFVMHSCDEHVFDHLMVCNAGYRRHGQDVAVPDEHVECTAPQVISLLHSFTKGHSVCMECFIEFQYRVLGG